jgi:hypothetical protein
MKGNKHSDKTPNPELADEENPGITPEELRQVRPAPEVWTRAFQAQGRARTGPDLFRREIHMYT